MAEPVERGAIIDGEYRYGLWRYWDQSKPAAVFIMLNPSTADAEADDPTIRRCMGFARAWEYGGIEVVNLFAYRATDPLAFSCVTDPIGPRNDDAIKQFTTRNPASIIAAWGAVRPMFRARIATVMSAIRTTYGRELFCLGVTKDGSPRHPLYVRGDTRPEPWGESASAEPGEEPGR